MRKRLAIVLAATALVVPAGAALAQAPPQLPTRDPNQLVTEVTLSGPSTDPTVLRGTAHGPDVPLATIVARGGYIEADAGIGCIISVQREMYWTLDDGAGNVLHGRITSGGGGLGEGSPTVSFVLKVTDGTGRFAGWHGWGSYDAYTDPTGCDLGFGGVWRVNRN